MTRSDTPVYANPENNLDDSLEGTNKQTVEINGYWGPLQSFLSSHNLMFSHRVNLTLTLSILKKVLWGERPWKPAELDPQGYRAVMSLQAALSGHRLQLDHIQVCVCFIHYGQRTTVFVTDCLCTICYLSSQWVTVAYFLCPALICWLVLPILINGHLGYSAWRYPCFCMTNM